MSEELEKFNAALKAYMRYNRRELGPLIENRGRRLQWELFRQYRSIAPTKERIEQEAENLNYAIRRGHNKRGKRLSVKQELSRRKRSIGWLSVSFLFRQWRSKRRGQRGSFAALSRRKKEIGNAVVRTAIGERRPFVRITSHLEGAAEQNRQHRIVAKALASQAADMKAYTLRKQRERIKQTITGTFSHIIGS